MSESDMGACPRCRRPGPSAHTWCDGPAHPDTAPAADASDLYVGAGELRAASDELRAVAGELRALGLDVLRADAAGLASRLFRVAIRVGRAAREVKP